MTTYERIGSDLKDAMRARDKDKVDALRLIMAAAKQIEVDERIKIDEPRMLVILDKLTKQRKESISQFQAANRNDLVEKEQFELDLITQYMPQPLAESEVMALVEQAIMANNAEKISDMGKVMAYLKPQLLGRADMAQVSTLIKNKLSEK